MTLRTAFQLLSPAGSHARLSILIFHRVLPRVDPLFPNEMHAERFDAVCRWLASWFNVLPLDQAARRLIEGSLPARAACITFDDGYADNYQVAMPILQRHGLTSTFFIATGFLDGGRMWNDSIIESVRRCSKSVLDLESLELGLGKVDLGSIVGRQAAVSALIDQVKYRPVPDRLAIVDRLARLSGVQLPDDLMMTSAEVRALHQCGMQVGAHTVSHPILAKTPDLDAEHEIKAGKATLEALLQQPVSLFAYPNGKPGADYLPRHVELVQQAGFSAAVTTAPGVSTTGVDHLQIPRFSPWDAKRFRFGLRLLSNLRNTSPKTV